MAAALIAMCAIFCAGGAKAQCAPTFTATPLNVAQTFSFSIPTSLTGCDPDGNGVYATAAAANVGALDTTGTLIPNTQIVGPIYGQFYTGDPIYTTDFFKYVPTSNPGVAYTDVVTYYSFSNLLGVAAAHSFSITIGGVLPPSITSISVAVGPTTGGTSVVLTGANLLLANSVSFGGVAGTITNDLSTSITVTSPAHAPGTVDILVNSALGTSSVVAADQFTYVTPPAITSISPTYGTIAGGTSVTINGTNFTGASSVLFGSTAGTITSTTPTQIVATAPAHAAGAVDIAVATGGGGQSPGGAGDQYTYIAQPVAGAVSATVAYDSSTDPITLNLSAGAPTSVAVATPAGHGTATASGTSITYTPATGYFGSDSFTYTATNSSGTSSVATVSVTVSAPVISVTPSTLTAGVLGTAYNHSLTASGGQAPYTFSTTVASGALPAGLTLSSTGTITGTPAATGTFTFTVGGTDSSTGSHANFTSSAISLTINTTVPGAPTIGSTTAANGQASVSFTAPASNGGSAITGYTVTSSPGGLTATGSSSPIVVTGLTNGTAYTFTVAATNSAGTGAASAASNAVTPIAPPSAGSVSATVAYDSNSNPITLNLSGGAAASVSVTAAASHGTATATGTGISYTPTTGYFGSDIFAYTASNGSGTSSSATASITVSAPMIAVLPTILAAGGLSSAYSQSLTANGGQAPYTFATTVASGALPAGLSLSSTGAITGTPTAPGTYSFTVSGMDSSTVSHASFTSSTISLTISGTVPGAPVIGVATPGNTQASVAFTPPTSNGGAAITSYTVTSSPGGSTATGSGSPIVVTGLTNGTAYSFTVTATNAAGTGAASAASNPVTPIAPLVAGSVSATVAYGSSANAILLNLSGGAATSVAVASAAGHGTATASGTSITYTPTTGYFGSDSFAYTATNGSGTSPAATVSVTVSAPAITVSPATLAAGTLNSAYSQSLTASGGQAPYTFATAVASGALPAGLSLSSAGAITGTPTATGTFTFTVSGTDSSAASHATFTSATISLTINTTAPGAPTIGMVTAGDEQASVRFAAPTSNGGAAIFSYTVTSSPGGLAATGSGSPIVVTGLTNGTAYTFTVAATNSAGISAPSAASNSVTPVALPVAGAVNATVSYNSSADAITLSLSGGAATSVAVVSAPVHGTVAVNGTSISYTPAIGYSGSDSFTYNASNTTGISGVAGISITVGAPTIIVLPTTLAGATAGVAYNQQLTASGGRAPYTFATTPASGTLPAGLSLSNTGVITGTPTASGSFTFTVSGTDSSTGMPANFISAPISLTVGSAAPGAPGIGLATSGNSQASIAFTPPPFDGGATITGYTVTSSPGGIMATGSGSPIVVTGLTNGTAYILTVTASNSIGTSAPSAASNSVTPGAAPIASAVSATVPLDSTASPITLNLTGGTATSVAVTNAASHGAATANGTTITYTPVAGYHGPDSFAYTGTNGIGTSSPATVSITVVATIVVGPNPAPVGVFGAAYAQTFSASGGQFPYTFSPTPASGTLPPGLSIASNGALAGTPTAAGTYTFTLAGTDSATPTPDSFNSAPISLTINPGSPGAPAIGAATAGDTQASVSFTPPATNGGLAITSYTVTSNPGGFTGTGTGSPIVVTGLTNGRTYTFTVTAANGVGPSVSSGVSNPVTAKAAQTVTFANPGPQNFGIAPTLTATSSAGLVPAFSSATPGVCTVTSGGALTTVTAGTCTVNADQAGNNATLAAAQVSRSFTIVAVAPGAPTVGTIVPGNGQATISFTPPASNGGVPITSYTVTANPGGITVTVTGSPAVITGLTNGVAYTFVVTASNSAGMNAASPPSNPVMPSAVVTATQTVASESLTQNHAAAPFTPVTGSSGTAPLVYSISPALPAGLTLSATAGAISGTATASSPLANYTVTVTDATNATAAAGFSLVVNGAVVATTGASPGTLTQNAAFAPFTPIAGSGGTASLTYSVSPSLPAGLSLSPTTGQITGTPTATSSLTNYTVTVTDANGAAASSTFSLAVVSGLTAAAKNVTATYNSGNGTSATIDLSSSISGGTATSVTVTGGPSHGATTASGLVVNYTPTVGFHGGDSFTYTATGTSGTSSPATVSINVSDPIITVSPTALPDGAAGAAYSQTLTPSGGAAPYIFSTVPGSGSLAAGLTISTAGLISGTPTVACTCTFTVTGSDHSTGNGSVSFSATISLTIVGAPPAVTSVSPPIGMGTGGTPVTITGTSFTAASTVNFGTAAAASVLYRNSTTITAVAPAGTGTVDITVTDVAGTSATSSADQFSYLAQVPALANPVGTALDGNGNLFIADTTLGYIVEVPAGCAAASCETIIGGGLTGITGVAVDANGSVFVLSGGSNGTVTEVPFDSLTNSFGAQTVVASGLTLPASSPAGIAIDSAGNLFVTNTGNQAVTEIPFVASADVYGAQVVLATGSGSSAPSGIAVDGSGNVFVADPGTQTVSEIPAGGALVGAVPAVLAANVDAHSVTVDGNGDVYYADAASGILYKLPWDGSAFGAPVVLATGLSGPYGLSIDDNGNLVIANSANQSIAKVTVDTAPSLAFASTKVGATSTDSPQSATLANIGTAPLTFLPLGGANPVVSSGFVLDTSATCPQVSASSAAQTVGRGASCSYAVKFSPTDSNVGVNNGVLLATDDNLNIAAATQSVSLSGTGIADDASALTLTVSPPSIIFGKSVSLSASVRDTTHIATIPTGHVAFTSTDGAAASTINPAAPLSNGTASVSSYTPAAAGSYTITGNYGGVAGDVAASSGTAALAVTQATPTLGYAPAPATQVYGPGIPAGALNATATDANGAVLAGSFSYGTAVNSAATSLMANSTVLPAGAYTIAATFTPADTADYIAGGTVSAAYTVTQTVAAVTLGSLTASYDGNAHSATATTSPANLNITLTYNGSASAPVNAGSYTVLATVHDPNYAGSATGTLVISQDISNGVTISSSLNPVLRGNPITFTANVSSTIAPPSGIVNFVDNTAGAVLGSGTLQNGVATFTTASLAVGDHSIVAAYQGDTNFLPLSSAAITQTVLDFTLNISNSGGATPSATVGSGGVATYQLVVSPAGSGTFPNDIDLSASNLPEGATYTFTPSVIAAGSGTTDITFVVQLAKSSTSLRLDGSRFAPIALALLLLPFAGRLRRTGIRLRRTAGLLLLAILAMATGLTGCGGAGSGFLGSSPTTYSININATSGVLAHTTVVTLTVQ